MKQSRKLLLILSLCGMMGASIGIAMNSLGVFYAPVSEALNVKRGTFALYTTFSSLSIAVAQMFVPKILTEKNFKKVYFGGVLLSSLSLMAMSLAKNVFHFYALAILMGIGNSCFNVVVITTILNTSITENAGGVTGLVLSFSGLVGALLSPLISGVIQSYGYPTGYLAVGAAMILFNLPGLLYPLQYRNPEKKDSNSSGQFGGNPLPFLYIGILTLFINLSVGMSQHLSGFALTRGIAASESAYLVSAMMIGNIFFKVSAGALADHIGPLKTSLSVSVLSLAGIILLLTQKSLPLLLAGAFLLGSLYAITSVLTVLFIKEIYGLEHYTSLYALANLIGSGVFALALSIIGYVYDFTSSYLPYLYGMLGMNLVMFVLFFLLAKSMRKKSSR